MMKMCIWCPKVIYEGNYCPECQKMFDELADFLRKLRYG